jgi:hypothetical protein
MTRRTRANATVLRSRIRGSGVHELDRQEAPRVVRIGNRASHEAAERRRHEAGIWQEATAFCVEGPAERRIVELLDWRLGALAHVARRRWRDDGAGDCAPFTARSNWSLQIPEACECTLARLPLTPTRLTTGHCVSKGVSDKRKRVNDRKNGQSCVVIGTGTGLRLTAAPFPYLQSRRPLFSFCRLSACRT